MWQNLLRGEKIMSIEELINKANDFNKEEIRKYNPDMGISGMKLLGMQV